MGHKRFSPSSAKMWLLCPGSIAMIESLPAAERDSGETIHSRRGTCAHTVGEMVLQAYINDPSTSAEAEDYLHMEVEKVIVDEKIVRGAQVYIDYCKGVIDQSDFALVEEKYELVEYVEDKQLLHNLYPDIDGKQLGGTSDLTAGQFMGRLFVVDYKNGTGGVYAEDNPQALSYGLGALIRFGDEYDFEEVELVIVQPNDREDLEPIRSHVMPVEEVYEWADEVMLPGVQKCLDAVDSFKRNDPDFIETYLVPGDAQCQWCPAKHKCPAALGVVCDNALVEFGDLVDLDHPFEVTLPDVNKITPEQERAILDNAEYIIQFIKDVQAKAHKRADQGAKIEGHKLVRKRSNRAYRDGIDEGQLKKACKQLGLHPHDYMNEPTFKSISQLEKVMKDKGIDKDAVGKFNERFVHKPEGGTILVPVSDNRAEVLPAIDAEFAELIEGDDILDL